MPEWDEWNRPKGYIISVTPGFAKFGAGEERLIYMGLARKITKAARLGFEFAQIDIEEVGEMFEPRLKEMVDNIKKLNKIEIGLHLPVNMDLCIARAYAWRQMHEQLVYGAIAAAEKLGAKYILFHSSSEARPDITATSGQRTPPAKLCAPDGSNLGNFIDRESKKGFNLKDWFIAKHIGVFFHVAGAPADIETVDFFDEKGSFKDGVKEVKEKIREMERKDEEIVNRANVGIRECEDKIIAIRADPRIPLNEKRKIEEELMKKIDEIRENAREERKMLHEEYKKWISIDSNLTRIDFEREAFDYWTRHGSEAEEYVAYHCIAKWMYKNKDPLWTAIVEDRRDPDEIIKEAVLHVGEKGELTDAVKQLITAVAAKYIEGHLKTKLGEYAVEVKVNGKKEKISVLDYCRAHKINIFIETNMPGGYGEHTAGAPPGELRIIKATDHVKIAKVIDPDIVGYCLDFEHLLTNYIDPVDEAKELIKTGDGKYIRCLHLNAPRPIVGAHAPLSRLSVDMDIVYRFLYLLRKAGWKNSYIVWEMGSYGVQETAIAFKNIVRELEKETPPDELPPEFYGIDKDFEAQQMTAIREHAWDPLEGLLVVPEERHTFLSRAALEKGKAREWEKEKYR